MNRRMIVCLGALLGVLALVASTSTASAQVGLPPAFDFSALFQTILNSLPAFLRSFLSGLFAALLNGLCALFGTCAS